MNEILTRTMNETLKKHNLNELLGYIQMCVYFRTLEEVLSSFENNPKLKNLEITN